MKWKSLLASASSRGPACWGWIPALTNGPLRQWHSAVLHGINQLQNDVHLQLHYWTYVLHARVLEKPVQPSLTCRKPSLIIFSACKLYRIFHLMLPPSTGMRYWLSSSMLATSIPCTSTTDFAYIWWFFFSERPKLLHRYLYGLPLCANGTHCGFVKSNVHPTVSAPSLTPVF